jgi:HEAT repeat protein
MRSCWLLALCFVAGCAIDPLPELQDGLEDKHPEVRVRAIEGLLALSADRSFAPLLKRLEVEDDPEVLTRLKVAAVVAGRRCTVESLQSSFLMPKRLSTALTCDSVQKAQLEDDTKAALTWVLGELGDRDAIPTLRTLGTPEANAALLKLGDGSVGMAFEVPM